MTYSIVDCADGRFAVIAIAATGARYRRGGLLTLAEAEACVEDLRVALACCGTELARSADGSDRYPPGDVSGRWPIP